MRRIIAAGLLLAVSLTAAESPKVLAIFDLSLQGDAAKLFTREERDQLTSVIRREGSRMLGNQLDIWSQGQMQKMITNNIASCSESSCLAGFIKSISADYGVQPTVRIAFDKLHLSLEVASDTRTLGSVELVAAPNKAGKNELGEKVADLAQDAFTQLSADLGLVSNQTKGGTIEDIVGTVVSFEFPQGPAVLMLDGRIACSNKERCGKEFPNGSHSVSVSRDGYRDSSFQIKVPQGSNRYSISLTPKSGSMTIRAQDAQDGSALVAQVFVDGSLLGNTPWTGTVPVNAQRISLHVDGYTDAMVADRPDEGKRKSVVIDLQAVPTVKVSNKKDGMVAINGDCFEMGSDDSEPKDEKPAHRVCLKSFRMDSTEVTVDAYARCVNAGTCKVAHFNDGTCFNYNLTTNKWEQVVIDRKFQGGDQPVSCVNWSQAQTYCNWAGKRLPTEAEFEFASRAGTSTRFPWGNSEVASCRYSNGGDSTILSTGVHWNNSIECQDGYGDVTSPVASFQPNSWGLYDMTGNVWEWNADYYSDTYYQQSPVHDPKGPEQGEKRSLRGGAWNSLIDGLRAARRYGDGTGVLGPNVGFRCAADK